MSETQYPPKEENKIQESTPIININVTIPQTENTIKEKRDNISEITQQENIFVTKNLATPDITDEKLRQVQKVFNFIFNNAFPEYLFCPSCDDTEPEGKRFSAKEIFGTNEEYISQETLESLTPFPPCPCCSKEMQFFQDPERTFKNLKEKLSKDGYLTITKNKKTQEIQAFTYGYLTTLKEEFEKEWKYKYSYTKELDDKYTRSFDTYLETLHKNKYERLTPDTEIFCWNCIVTDPRVRGFQMFQEIMSNFFNSVPQELKDIKRNVLVIGETMITSPLYGLVKISGAHIIHDYFEGDYVLVINTLRQFAETFSLPMNEFKTSIINARKIDKFGYIQHKLDNVKVEIQKTQFGKGVFAKEDIQMGETIAAFHGPLLEAEKLSDLPNDPPLYTRDHVIQIGPREYVHGKYCLSELINHSCNPNCGIKNKVEITSMRDIQKGEEITWDYEMSENSDWHLECKCGAPNCRGIIRAYRFLSQEIREKYKGFISEWLEKTC